MKRTYIKDLKQHIGEQVLIKAWCQTTRGQGGVAFLILRDISGIIQSVVTKGQGDVFATAKGISNESVLEVIATAKSEEKAPGGVELMIEEIKVLSHANPELPIPVVEKGSEVTSAKRQDWRFLALRRPEDALIMKISTLMDQAYRNFLVEKNFIEIHSPKLMSSPSESTSDLFTVKYFDRKAYLAQSPQFYKQMAMAAGLERVFEVAPIFRAEKSFTTRHATEAISYDIEMSFIDSPEDVYEMMEQLMVYIYEEIKAKYGTEIEKHFGINIDIPSLPFPRISIKETREILKKNVEVTVADGDLTTEEEKAIGTYVKKEMGHDFVFITDFPVSARPFYHKRKNAEITASGDLLMLGVEISTAAQREENYDVLIKQAEEKKLDTKNIEWYLDFFKYGCPSHGGCGIGGARILMQMLGLPSIREAMYIYRGVNRLTP